MYYDFKAIEKQMNEMNFGISLLNSIAWKFGLSQDKTRDFEIFTTKHDQFFHDYPYQQFYEATACGSLLKQNPLVTNQIQFGLEYVLNRNDFEDSMKYFVAKINGETEKAEEIKAQILAKVARRRQGFVDEVGDNPALIMARRDYNQERAQTGRNPFDPHVQPQINPQQTYHVLNGIKTTDGRAVLINDEQLAMLREFIYDAARQNGYIERERLNLSTVPDPNDGYQESESQPIFQNSQQYQAVPQQQYYYPQQQEPNYQNVIVGGIPYQQTYVANPQAQFNPDPEPQPAAAPVQQEPEQPAQQQLLKPPPYRIIL